MTSSNRCDAFKFIILHLICLICVTFAETDWPDCAGEETTVYTNPNKIGLFFEGDILSHPDTNIISIESSTNNAGFPEKYIDAEFYPLNRTLRVFVTDKFPTYPEIPNAVMRITLKIQYRCGSEQGNLKEWIFYQYIQEDNYFDPEFSQDKYEFSVPLPLYQGFDLTAFQKISATDKDISNYRVSFSSPDSEDVKITVGNSGQDGKTFFASLELVQILLTINESIQFTIVATDNGNPPRNSSALVVITASPTNTLPPQPRFQQILYEGSLDDNLTLLTMESLVLEPSTYSENVTFAKIGEDEDLFEIEQIENEVAVSLSRALTAEDVKDKFYLKFTIEASRPELNETGRTGVVITVPVVRDDSHFEKTLYQGTIRKDGSFELEDLVFVTNEKNLDALQFSMDYPDADLFDLDISTTTVKLSLRPEVNESDWKEKSFLSVKVLAQIEDILLASTEVVIDVPKRIEQNFWFEKPMYIGRVNEDNKLSLEDVKLQSSEDDLPSNLTIDLQGEDSDLFTVQRNENVLTIKFKNESEIDWRNKTFLSLLVVAQDVENDLSTSVAVFIQLPVEHFVFAFEQSLYEGSIDKTGSLTIEPVVLKQESFSDDVRFSYEGHGREYFNFTTDANRIEISLKDNSKPEDWKDEQFILFLVRATRNDEEQTTTAVVINLPKPEKKPEFERSLYSGEISTENELRIDQIVLKPETFENYTTFQLEGDDANLFKFTSDENRISLVLERNLTLEEMKNKRFAFVTVIALNEDVKGHTTAVLKLPDFTKPKIFKDALLSGRVSANQTLDVGDIRIEDDVNADGLDFTLTGDESGYFETSFDPIKKAVKINLFKDLPEEVIETKAYSTLVLECDNRRENTSDATAIVLELPGRSDSSSTPQFSKKLYKGQLNDFFELSVEEIKVTEEADVFLEGKDSDLFNASLEDGNVLIKLKRNLTNSDVKDKRYLEFLLVATSASGSRNSANVIVDIPWLCECPEPEPCPTPEPPTDVPKFEKDFYSFWVLPDFTGSIGRVSATIAGSAAQVAYSIDSQNDHLTERIWIDKHSGELHVTSFISPGVYLFDLVAENVENGSKGRSSARLEVDTLSLCGDDVHVASSLLIKEIEEEQRHEEILSTVMDDCHLEIFSMEPSDKDYFLINESTHMLTSIAIDREDEIFSNMLVPQIQVKLKLKCPEEGSAGVPESNPSQRRSRRSITTSRNKSTIITDDIMFSTDTTMLSVILTDINDNPPQFVNPPQNHFIVGYPEPKIAADILPEYLYKVEATDKDEGLNAKIRFKVEDNPHFGIEPSTGLIYPLASALHSASDMNLKIYATDRDGAKDGLTTAIEIRVKKLEAKHLTLLTFEAESFAELEDIHGVIKDKTGVDFQVVKKAIVPKESEGSSRGYMTRFSLFKQNSEKVILKVWAYALDGNGQQLESEDVEKKLSGIEEDLKLSAESYEEAKKAGAHDDQDAISVTGYIVGVTLLSIVAAACIGFLTYWFYIRKRILDNLTPTSSASATPPYLGRLQKESEFKEYQINDQHIYDYPPSHYQKRESVRIVGTTLHETSDETKYTGNHLETIPYDTESVTDSMKSSENSEDYSDGIVVNRPRTTVTFNEMVERIHIDTNEDGISARVVEEDDNDDRM